MSKPKTESSEVEQSYQVRSYDIVGGSVNDVRVFGNFNFPTVKTTFNIGTDQEFDNIAPSDDQIVDTLKVIGFLALNASKHALQFEGDDDCIYINMASNGDPFCELLKN